MSDEQSTDQGHGRFVWYDLMTNDAAGAEAFYTSVLPWKTAKMEIEGGAYTMWTLGGPEDSIGGIGPPPAEGVPPHWSAYVAVADVDATAARAGELGGAVHLPPTDIPGVGRFAVLADPQGGAIAVYRSATQPPGPLAQPKVGQFSWHELATGDLAAATEFYFDLFGWTALGEHDMGPMGVYRIYGQGDVPYGGIFKRPPEMPVTAWLCYVRVDDLDATVAKVTQDGGQVVNGPMDVPGGDRIAQCVDPQGAMFALHEHRS